MNIRNIPTWLGLLAALYLVTACDRVYDDLSGCLGNTIVFSYLADDNREHLQEYVDDIDVFIFDVGNGALVEKHHLEGEQLLSPLEVRLPEGDYKVVAVGNALNETVIGDGAYGEASVSRPELAEKDGSAAGTFDRLYLGETTITSKVMNDSRDVVRLYSQHVKIHAVVLPDDDENAGTWYEQNKGTGFRLTMETLSARFSFSGQRSGETSFDLPFYTGGKNDRFVLDFNTLRFKDGDPLTICIPTRYG